MKKKDLVAVLLDGRIKNTKFCETLDTTYATALAKNKARYEEDRKRLQELETRYEDGLDGQRDDIDSSFITGRDSINKKHAQQKELYTRACSINIEEGYLHFFVTKMVDENLTSEERAKLELIEMAGKKYRLLKARIKVPKKFANKDPREDTRFACWIINKLRCNCLTALILAAEWMEDGKIEFV